MNDLLAQAIAAHGGLDRWNKFHKITTTIVGGGVLWPMKGLDLDFSSPREMTVTLHEERASISPFGQPELRTAFTPDRIAIETTTGAEAVSGRLPFAICPSIVWAPVMRWRGLRMRMRSRSLPAPPRISNVLNFTASEEKIAAATSSA